MRGPILQECHGRALWPTQDGALVRRLANWPGQTRNVDAYVWSCEVCQRTKVDHAGPRGLLHPLPLAAVA